MAYFIVGFAAGVGVSVVFYLVVDVALNRHIQKEQEQTS